MVIGKNSEVSNEDALKKQYQLLLVALNEQYVNAMKIHQQIKQSREIDSKMKTFNMEQKQSFNINLSQEIKIGNQNVQGMSFDDFRSTKFEMIKNIIEDQKIDIMILTEIKRWKEEWYKEISRKRQMITAIENERGGVGIIMNNEKFKTKIIEKFGNTSIMIQVKFLNENDGINRVTKFIVVALYVNPLPKEQEIKYIKSTMIKIEEILKNCGQSIIIAGDMNSNGNKMLKEISEKYKQVKLHITVPTWQMRREGHLIEKQLDQIMTSGIEVKDLQIKELNISDHKFQSVTLKKLQFSKQLKQRSKQEIEQKWKEKQIIKTFLKGCYPIQSTEEMIEKIIEKKPLQNQLKTLKIDFQKSMNDIKKQIEQKDREVHDYFENWLMEIEESKDQEQLYQYIKMTRAGNKGTSKKVEIVTTMNKDNKMLSIKDSQKEIAKDMAKKFRSQIKEQGPSIRESVQQQTGKVSVNEDTENIIKEIQSRNTWLDYHYLKEQIINQNLVEEFKIIYENCEDAIKYINKKKAIGTDLMSGLLLKETLEIGECQCQDCQKYKSREKQINDMLGIDQHIWTQCDLEIPGKKKLQVSEEMHQRLTIMIVLRLIPTYMISTRMALLSKIKDPVINSIKDIRPIGIISYAYRIIEKTMKRVIDKEYPELFKTEKVQIGFTKGKQTMDHTINMLERIEKERELKGQQKKIYVAIDISAAYDSVLIGKLNGIICKKAENWKSPLKDIIVENIIRANENITVAIDDWMFVQNTGLIQGSSLAPDLWKIYLDDMLKKDKYMNERMENWKEICERYERTGKVPEAIKQRNILGVFADDMISEFYRLQDFSDWDNYKEKIWKEYNMNLNPNKTKIMIFGKVDKDIEKNKFTVIRPNNDQVHYEKTNKVIYLGIPLTTRRNTKMQQKEWKDMVKEKIRKTIYCSAIMRSNLKIKIQNIYMESIIRYYSTPMVLANKIKINDMIEIIIQFVREFNHIPRYINNKVIAGMIPQFEWQEYWYMEYRRMEKIQFLENRQTMWAQFNVIRGFELETRELDRIGGYQNLTLQKPQYKLESMRKESGIIMQNFKNPEQMCINCERKELYQMTNRLPSDDRYIFTDASTIRSNGRGVSSYAWIDMTTGFCDAAIIKDARNDRKYVTNNVAELVAILEALKWAVEVKDDKKIIVMTDSKYSLDAIRDFKEWLQTKRNQVVKNAGILAKISEIIVKNKNEIILEHVKAHDLKNYMNEGNIYADFIANTLITGIARPPVIKLKIPKVTDEEPQAMCEMCRVIWRRRDEQERSREISIWKLKKYDLKEKMKKYIQEETYLWENKAQIKKITKMNEIKIYFEKIERGIEIRSMTTVQNSIQEWMPAKYKIIKEELKGNESDKDLERMIQDDKDEIETEKIVTYLKEEEVRGILKTKDDIERNNIIRMLKRTGKLKDIMTKFGGYKIVQRKINWEESLKKFQQIGIIMKIRGDRNLSDIVQQWKGAKIMKMKNEYCKEIDGMIRAMGYMKGMEKNGILVCNRCSMEQIVQKANLNHLVVCWKDQINKEEQLMIEKMIQIHRYLKSNGMQPRSTGLLVNVVAWSKEVRKVYDTLIQNRVAKYVSYAEFERVLKLKKEENKQMCMEIIQKLNHDNEGNSDEIQWIGKRYRDDIVETLPDSNKWRKVGDNERALILEKSMDNMKNLLKKDQYAQEMRMIQEVIDMKEIALMNTVEKLKMQDELDDKLVKDLAFKERNRKLQWNVLQKVILGDQSRKIRYEIRRHYDEDLISSLQWYASSHMQHTGHNEPRQNVSV